MTDEADARSAIVNDRKSEVPGNAWVEKRRQHYLREAHHVEKAYEHRTMCQREADAAEVFSISNSIHARVDFVISNNF